MRQNRVNPTGDLIRTNERGSWIGNRGVIHNEQKQIVRPFKMKAWICCSLQYKNLHREIMQPNRWTELFFSDEAAAFSAGHRPCNYCRHKDHVRFKEAWIKGNPEYGFTMKTPIAEIDTILHGERIAKDKSKISYTATLRLLPDGTFINHLGGPHLVREGKLFPWTFSGYGKGLAFPKTKTADVLTPTSIVNAFLAGYVPQIGTLD